MMTYRHFQDAFYTENANMTKDEGKEYISSTWWIIVSLF